MQDWTVMGKMEIKPSILIQMLSQTLSLLHCQQMPYHK